MYETLKSILLWFSGGAMQYRTLWHCMEHDTLWVIISVSLDVAIATGYVIIAAHWGRNARMLPDSAGKRALGNLRGIFIFCGICGYLFMPIKLFWPAWRLYDMFLGVLVFYTWRYVLSSQNLRVVYNELGRTSQLRKELEASQADVARRSAFLNAVSHDLRTPLNSLSLRTDLAEMQLVEGDVAALRATLGDIKSSTHSVSAMLDQLLEYARMDRGDAVQQLERFPLHSLVASVLLDVGPQAAEKGLRISSRVPQHLELRTDPIRLRRILSNLLGNAIKFTPPGAGSVGPPGSDIVIAAEHDHRNLEVHVIDCGVGIPPDKQESVFEEFVQVGNDARAQGRGFGLGLPIARRLAHQLGGEIRLQSTPGKGSRFSIVLPNVVPGEAEPAGAPVGGMSPVPA